MAHVTGIGAMLTNSHTEINLDQEYMFVLAELLFFQFQRRKRQSRALSLGIMCGCLAFEFLVRVLFVLVGPQMGLPF